MTYQKARELAEELDFWVWKMVGVVVIPCLSLVAVVLLAAMAFDVWRHALEGVRP